MWAMKNMFTDFSLRNLEGTLNLELGDLNSGPGLSFIIPVASGKLLNISKPTFQPCYCLCQVKVLTIPLHSITMRTKENACEHWEQHLAFVKGKINVSYHHPHYYCPRCWRSWEGCCGSKFLYLFCHCLHGELSEGAETPRTAENRTAWLGKHFLGIFQAKIKCFNGCLACTLHILYKATTNSPPDDLIPGFSLKI